MGFHTEAFSVAEEDEFCMVLTAKLARLWGEVFAVRFETEIFCAERNFFLEKVSEIWS